MEHGEHFESLADLGLNVLQGNNLSAAALKFDERYLSATQQLQRPLEIPMANRDVGVIRPRCEHRLIEEFLIQVVRASKRCDMLIELPLGYG